MAQSPTKLFFKLAACSILATIALAASADDHKEHEDHEKHKAHWGYVGKIGARAWGNLEPDYSICKLGKAQSPINIQGTRAKKAALPALAFHYVPETGEVVNNGHTIQVNVAPGSSVKLDDGDYKLVQFHFHTPSEERVDGKPYPMEAHFVHQNEAGRLAVVAMLLKKGKENATLREVFDNLPTTPDTTAPLATPINLAEILPKHQGYYHYIGSLTTPPCSEDVSWQILKEPVEVSEKQLKAFRKLYKMNARPVQQLNGRNLEKS